jgi:SPP1 gp7 family putative phage head morphogenesis protein
MNAKQVKASLITSALGQSIDARAIVSAYMHTHPTVGDQTQDRVRARAWATHSVHMKTTIFTQVLHRHYANLYAFGLHEGKDLMAHALRMKKGAVRARHNSAVLPKPIALIDRNFTMDWSSWKPGNEAAALLLDKPGGLATLLDGLDIKSLVNTTLDQLGTQLADGIRIGATPTQIARDIQDSVTSSSRALTISLTEGSRAAIEANKQSFLEQGVEQWEWTVNAPEDEDCLENDGVIVNIGDDFPSGEDQPPQHVNCQCSCVPTMPDMSAFGDVDPNITGYEDL